MSFKEQFLELYPKVDDEKIKEILFKAAEEGKCKIENNCLCYTSDVAKQIALRNDTSR
jgi:hypothetical protein